MALAGQGLRDVTRIAASDPDLWTQILAGNAPAVREVLARAAWPTSTASSAPSTTSAPPPTPPAPAARWRGPSPPATPGRPASRASTAPPPPSYTTVRVLIPDEPGQLGRLFADIGTIGTNIEEFHLDHGLGQPFGLAEVDVVPAAAAGLRPGPGGAGLAAARLRPPLG